MNVSKEFYDYEKFRREEYSHIYRNLFVTVTENIEPNKNIYNKIVPVSVKGKEDTEDTEKGNKLLSEKYLNFTLANSACFLLLARGIRKGNIDNIAKGTGGFLNLTNFIKFIGQFGFASVVNYSLFCRSFLNEYPFKDSSSSVSSLPENKIERLMHSLVDPYYIFLKDRIILTFVFLVSLPFNLKANADNINKSMIEMKIKSTDKNAIQSVYVDVTPKENINKIKLHDEKESTTSNNNNNKGQINKLESTSSNTSTVGMKLADTASEFKKGRFL